MVNREMESKRKVCNDLFKYCPICGRSLYCRGGIDILAEFMECQNSHRVYSPLKRVKTHQTGLKYRDVQFDSEDAITVAKEWLTNEKYREHLNDMLAEIIRLFLEIEAGTYNNQAQHQREVKFCPICGSETAKLTELDKYDVYGTELICTNQHKLYYRNCVAFVEKENRSELCQDMDYDFLLRATTDYLEKKQFQEYVPDQIKDLLRYFLEKERRKGIAS